jgi:mono/diheme cytochrome c family protein
MMRIAAFSAVGLIAAVVAGWLWFGRGSGPETGLQSPTMMVGGDDPVAGEALYLATCAACHGVNLEGQADWRYPGEDGLLPAPPHDIEGHTWHHGDEMLFSYIKLGGKEALAREGVDFLSAMPGYSDQLDDQQIRDILAYFKSTWPAQQRQYQADRTEEERLQKEENQ